MARKLSVGVIAAALLMSGALAGVSFGGGSGITQPEVVELSLDVCGRSCRLYPLRDDDGRRTGVITMSKDPVSDADGNEVGHLQQHCAAGKTNWVCTDVVTLRAGPHTERGTVVTTGIYRFNDISRFAVTGGTGAYENVRGFATLEDQGDAVLTLNLIP